jgi:hypothetical protein
MYIAEAEQVLADKTIARIVTEPAIMGLRPVSGAEVAGITAATILVRFYHVILSLLVVRPCSAND